MASLALGDIHLRFAWQVWYLRHWAGSGGVSPSATPATQSAAASPATTNPVQARHQSQPSALSAMPAMQNEGGCRQVPPMQSEGGCHQVKPLKVSFPPISRHPRVQQRHSRPSDK